MRNLSILLYATNGIDDDLREDYKDFLENENYTEDDISFDEWKEDFNDDCINDLFENIKYSKFNTRCVIVGTLGLWNGNKDIYPCVCDTLLDAIQKCINNVYDVEISLENGAIHIDAFHHDGTNRFDIHLLNKKGNSLKNGDLTKKCYYKKIFDF